MTEEYSNDADLMERYNLVMERITAIAEEPEIQGAFGSYMQKVAKLFLDVSHISVLQQNQMLRDLTFEEHKKLQAKVYRRTDPKNYSDSFLRPQYACEQLGEELGGILSALYADCLAAIQWAYQGRVDLIVLYAELFVMIHGSFLMEMEEAGSRESEQVLLESVSYLKESVYDTVRWFYHDNCEIIQRDAVLSMIDPSENFYRDIVETADFEDLSYLFWYGSYISDDVIKMAEFMNSRTEAEVKSMADTFTEGYRIGFEVTRKDLSKKKTVKVEYPIGMERMVRHAIQNFKDMGLSVTMQGEANLSLTGRGSSKRGVYNISQNPQMEFDHRNDRSCYLDHNLVNRRIEVLKDTFAKHKKLALQHGGPAVIEVFGEPDFTPVSDPYSCHYSQKQNKLNVSYASQASEITNTYIPGDERSFTIIAFPLPSIGEEFEAIFEKTIEINTLDYVKYQNMQQKIIDVLDLGEQAVIKGCGNNETDLTVQLHGLKDPSKETRFENCVADVNIPVGEVFTSPVLEGTNGLLHVSRVYLNGVAFKNLRVAFKDGMTESITCENFDNEEDNRRLIDENILFFHPTLPMGEFAIGTNTTAYRMGKDFDIAAKLPILIAEKTGPHFAVGDTCYSHAEDVAVYNPDGKEIVARDNSVSLLRHTDRSKAYLNCHTDITIPFEELGEISAVTEDGRKLPIILNGKFTVEGCEELNLPLENEKGEN